MTETRRRSGRVTPRDRVQSVERALDILVTLGDGPKTLAEVCRLTGLSKGTAFRLLNSLNHEGFVVRDPGSSTMYMLGPGYLRLSQGLARGFGSLGALGRPALLELWSETKETVMLHVRIGLERICVDEIPSPHPLRFTAQVGAAEPLHVGSAGKVLLAFMEPADLEQTLASLPLRPLTESTITELDVLRTELDATRERGWATSVGERIVGGSGISAPVEMGERLTAALSILGPTSRLPHERLLSFVEPLTKTARAIAASIAGAVPQDGSR